MMKEYRYATLRLMLLGFLLSCSSAWAQLPEFCSDQMGAPVNAMGNSLFVNLTSSEFSRASLALTLASINATCGADRVTVFMCEEAVKIALEDNVKPIPKIPPKTRAALQTALVEFLSIPNTQALVCSISLTERGYDPMNDLISPDSKNLSPVLAPGDLLNPLYGLDGFQPTQTLSF
jgi:sulfur relay (sulfurtransferase) complex TusBCD TusD component (DsrE family)